MIGLVSGAGCGDPTPSANQYEIVRKAVTNVCDQEPVEQPASGCIQFWGTTHAGEHGVQLQQCLDEPAGDWDLALFLKDAANQYEGTLRSATLCQDFCNSKGCTNDCVGGHSCKLTMLSVTLSERNAGMIRVETNRFEAELPFHDSEACDDETALSHLAELSCTSTTVLDGRRR